MSAALRRYRFATAAQWRAGLVSRADVAKSGTLAPAAFWGAVPSQWSFSARAVAVAPDGTIYWNANGSQLFTLDVGENSPIARSAPAALAAAHHLVADRTQLWAADARPELRAYLRDSLSLRQLVRLDVERIIDLAADGRDGVWVLSATDGCFSATHVDCAGQTIKRIRLPADLCSPRGLAYLSRSDRLVVLAGCGTRLIWFDANAGAPPFETSLRAVRACPIASAITSNTRDLIAVAGSDDAAFGGGAWVMGFDAAGDPLGVIDLPAAAIDLALSSQAQIVATRNAVLRYARSGGAQAAGTEVSAQFVTPALHSPPTEARAPWLRAEARAELPPGTWIELSWAATDDPIARERANAILRDSTRSPSDRWHLLRSALEFSAPFRFERSTLGASESMVCALPLHDVKAHWLWLAAAVVAAPEAEAPRLQSLEVLYPDESLLQHLPAVYQRQAAQPGDFLRSLVALLETTTQGIDERIEHLGRLLDPTTTDERWLDTLARWTGIPWHDSIPLPEKRALLMVADSLLKLRGTRTGLEALLNAVLPPGRARVIDVGADYGYARLDCESTAGARLPALLGGLPAHLLVLGRKARIGGGRLACDDDDADCGSRLAGAVVIEVRASGAERRLWMPWLRTLIDEMTPLTANVRMRWLDAAADQPDVLHGELKLEAEPDARLGEGAIVGRARLGSAGSRTLDAIGADIGFRLQ